MVVNLAEFFPGDFTRNADFSLPTERLKRAISTAAGAEQTHFIDANRIATALFGCTLAANVFLVGYAYQLGAIPLTADAIEQAIALNGEAVKVNLAAFRFGRRAAVDPAGVEALAKPAPRSTRTSGCRSRSTRRLSAASNSSPPIRAPRYAARYRALVEKAKAAEAAKAPGACGFAEAVARYLFKLMAYKDEYEVARLYTDGNFAQAGRLDVRRQGSAVRIPSRAAAVGQARSGDRRAAQDVASARG